MPVDIGADLWGDGAARESGRLWTVLVMAEPLLKRGDGCFGATCLVRIMKQCPRSGVFPAQTLRLDKAPTDRD